jgi:protein involved in polysaccharide export with SLBB domain
MQAAFLAGWFFFFYVGPVLAGQEVLGSGDTIQLNIRGIPAADIDKIKGQYQIDAQGCVSMPDLGKVKIAGLSIGAAQTAIETGYRAHDVYTNPTINIKLEAHALWVNVGGEVKNPQRIAYTDDLTLLGSIDAAGGFSPVADQRKVLLLRDDRVRIINVQKIRADPSLDIPVRPGDRIEVPPDLSSGEGLLHRDAIQPENGGSGLRL